MGWIAQHVRRKGIKEKIYLQMKSREMLKLGHLDSYTVKGYYKSVTKSISSISESRERGRLSLESTLSRFLCLWLSETHTHYFINLPQKGFSYHRDICLRSQVLAELMVLSFLIGKSLIQRLASLCTWVKTNKVSLIYEYLFKAYK